MKTTYFLLVALCGTVAGLNPPSVAAQTANPQTAGETETTPPLTLVQAEASTSNKPVRLSWGLDEIAKLSRAKVDESVILAFVENSETAYNPTAQDIVQLRELGASSQVITALMRRGEALRQTGRESQKQVQAEQAAAVAAASESVNTQPNTICDPSESCAAPVSTVTVIGYPRPRHYAYPSYSYSYAYPNSYYYYPRYRAYGYGCYPRISLGLQFGGGYYRGYHGGGRYCR